MSGGDVIVLAILGMILVGPERLPKLASEAASLIRRLQRIAHAVTEELRENLGPGFENLQPSDLNPKTFIRQQLAEVLEEQEEPNRPESKIDPDVL